MSNANVCPAKSLDAFKDSALDCSDLIIFQPLQKQECQSLVVLLGFVGTAAAVLSNCRDWTLARPPHRSPFIATNSLTAEDVDILGTDQRFFRVRRIIP